MTPEALAGVFDLFNQVEATHDRSARRAGDRAGPGQEPDRAARRHGLGPQRRPGPRQRVRRPPADPGGRADGRSARGRSPRPGGSGRLDTRRGSRPSPDETSTPNGPQSSSRASSGWRSSWHGLPGRGGRPRARCPCQPTSRPLRGTAFQAVGEDHGQDARATTELVPSRGTAFQAVGRSNRRPAPGVSAARRRPAPGGRRVSPRPSMAAGPAVASSSMTRIPP